MAGPGPTVRPVFRIVETINGIFESVGYSRNAIFAALNDALDNAARVRRMRFVISAG